MHRRKFLRETLAGVGGIAGIAGFGLNGVAQESPSAERRQLAVKTGDRTPISIFRTDASEQPKLLATLLPKPNTSVQQPSGAVLASFDAQRVIVYGKRDIGQNEGVPSESHDYEVVYVKHKEAGSELTIDDAFTGVTLVNAFGTSPDTQQQLVDVWLKNAGEIEAFAGFVCTALHRSSDGKSVINYAQWRSKEDWWQMANAEMAKFKEKNPFGHADPHLYAVKALF